MDKLIFPHSFNQAEKDFLIAEFQALRLSVTQAQEVIYETMARIEMRHPIKCGPARYCAGLARIAATGKFTLNFGVKVKIRIENPDPKTEFNLQDGSRFIQAADQSIWVYQYNVARRVDGAGPVYPKSDFTTALADGRFQPL
ncbi:MAG: hypothetical protein KGL42_00445 [Betaproteobacteria bacterium]|nr:hypothetical protein [Betaproteobacteria bacterium]